MKHFYEKNTYLLESDVNKNFEEVLWMSDDEFRQWLRDMRKEVAYAWDELGLPPRVGFNEEQIIDQFNKMSSFPVHEFLVEDELTGEKDVIRNTSIVGNAANQWFPTMMKTKIVYNDISKAKSIYDHFVDEDLFQKVYTYGHRHFKRDSFYHYSNPIKHDEIIELENVRHKVSSGADFVRWFESHGRQYDTHDYWLKPDKEQAYTGYDDKLRDVKWVQLTREEIETLNIPSNCKVNMLDEYDVYQIMFFKKGQKMFPLGFKPFRISWCQYAVNFPPLTAKYLYERFTEHFREQRNIRIWDPSSGWGGRILGAMSVSDDRNIHYIGTDPNTDHTVILDDGTKSTKYEELAKFFNLRTYRGAGLFPHTNTFEIHQCGSEVFECEEESIDMVFTSPPYFAKEAYSEDEEQSYKKFGQYEAWVEGFLRPTLENAYKYLKHDRYLLWNIADAKFGNEMLPLEGDSINICKELGFEHVTTLKMALAQMPGGNRVDEETGKPRAKNFCKVNGIWLKYEPIFVFYKA
jgi:hypothetical protein